MREDEPALAPGKGVFSGRVVESEPRPSKRPFVASAAPSVPLPVGAGVMSISVPLAPLFASFD